eukprot:3095196-Pleurochrysis_carterae.AAC.1
MKSAPSSYKLPTRQRLAGARAPRDRRSRARCTHDTPHLFCWFNLTLPPAPMPLHAGSLLADTMKRLYANEQPLRAAALAHKCTVITDGWDDVKSNHLGNVLVGSAWGIFFQGTKKLASTDHEDAESVASIVAQGIQKTGALSV